MAENAANTILGGCLVLVDTKDKSGNDNSKLWQGRVVEMGGKIAQKVTDKVTQVVFQSGRRTVGALPSGVSPSCSRPTPSAPQTWDAAANKGVPRVSIKWLSDCQAEEEQKNPEDYPAAPPKPGEAPQKAMEPAPIRVHEPPESSSQVRCCVARRPR